MNEAAQAELLGLIRGQLQLQVVNGEGEWAEPAVLLPRTSLADLVRLGRQFGQAAVLAGVGQRVALVWLEADGIVIERYWVEGA